MKTNKVLILTANYGDGHIKVAKSIEKGITNISPEIQVKTVNLFQEAHPILNEWIRDLYLICYSKTPLFYDFLYYSTKDIKRNFYLNNLIGLFGRTKLKQLLKEFEPDVVINTFPVLAMPIMYKKGKTRIPCYTVITDYGLHSQWIDPGISKYFIGHESLEKQLLEQGVSKDLIKVTGIPVTIESDGIDRNEFIEKYKLSHKNLPIITFLGGANGVQNNLAEIVSKFYKMQPEAQFIITCGKNKILYEHIKNVASQFEDRIKVFGFVDNLHEIMRGSDIVISKAGGITTTEALNMGIPLIIYGTPAGQEKENTKFLAANNCAFHAKNINQLMSTLAKVTSNHDLIAQMKENTKSLKRPNGWSLIAEHVLETPTHEADYFIELNEQTQ